MKRSTSLLLGGGALLVAGVVLVPLTSATADSGPKRVRLELTESSTAFHFIDAPAPAADGQAGDLITFESDLSRTGTSVGSLEGHCVQIRANGTLDDCDVTVTIGADSYRMSGPFDPATGGTLTITGGTGGWVGASGTDTITNQPDGTAIHAISLVRR